MNNSYETRKVELMTLFRRQMNGAVVDAMKSYDQASTLVSYGVSLPTLKSICASFEPDNGFACHLYKSKVRELKLSAIFLAESSKITPDQIEEWSCNYGSYEIVLHLSKLFATTPVSKDYIEGWMTSSDSILNSLALLTIAKSGLTEDDAARYSSYVLSSLSNFNTFTENSYISAIMSISHVYPQILESIKQLDNSISDEIISYFL